MTPTERLRRDTRDAHRRLERCRFGRALVEARVDRQDYVDYLRALTVLVATLATQIRRHGAPDDRTVGAPLAGWAKLLQRDLADLVAPATPANLTASDAALEGARRVRLAVGDGTARLLGWLYVLRGSHRGNRTVADGVTRALGLVDSAGTRYLRATAGEGDDGWRACREALDRSLLEERRFAAALAGAEDAFATFQRLLEAIGPEAPRAPHVTALNPEAGDHAIVAEPRLIELASEAADRAMSALPYLGLRFGERGALYARSDSAWLVTLCELPTAFAEQQADWLGALLSARGLPTLCLEAHLRVLADVLAPALPEAKLATFRRLADRIAARRGDVLPEERFAAAADLVLPPLGARSGQLLLAAAADQAAGVAACADSLRAWVVGELEVDAEARDALLRFLDDALAEALPLIRWCSYCQRFLGERAPFDVLTVSHGLCRLCADKGHATAAISPRILEVADFFTELLRRSRDGRPVPACELSSRASQLGISHSDLLVGMVQPVLAEIGRLFAAGHVPVHHEHKLSQEVEALLDGFPKPRPAADAKRVLLCLPGGNTHRLGPRLFGQLLAEQGVHADIVAAPAAETILPRLARERYDAVGLSVALPDQVPAAVAIAEAVKASAPGAVTALGGPVTKGPLPESVRVRFDLVDDPSKGPVCAEELVAALRGGPPPDVSRSLPEPAPPPTSL